LGVTATWGKKEWTSSAVNHAGAFSGGKYWNCLLQDASVFEVFGA
jgi:hypothetical protein